MPRGIGARRFLVQIQGPVPTIRRTAPWAFFDNILAPFTDKAAKQAAADQTAGLNKGYDLAGGLYKAGNQALTAGYGQAGDMYAGLQKGTQAGSDAYGDASGANGPEGLARAKALFTATPGYQSGFDLLTDANDRRAASRGALGSGNTIADTAKLATTYADQNYGGFAQRLQPYLGANAGAVAGGAGVATGLGTALNANDVGQGQLGFGVQAGIGNANANADLAKNNAGANIWNLITKLGGGAANVGGGGGFDYVKQLFGGGGGGPYGGTPGNNPLLNPATYGNIR